MMHFGLPEHDPIGYLLRAGIWLPAGAVIGVFHFLTLRWNVRMFAAGQSLLLPSAIQLVRLVLIAVVLATITRSFGVLPLLAATAGVLLARTAIVRLEVRQ